MKRYLAFLLCLILIVAVREARADGAERDCPVVPIAGEMCWDVADPAMPAAPIARLKVRTFNHAESSQFAWPVYSLLYQDSDVEAKGDRPASESVAVYGQTVKRGKAPGWGVVGECRAAARGGCYAAEFDLVNDAPIAPGDHRTAVFVAGWGSRGGVGLEVYGQFDTGVQVSPGLGISLDGGRGDSELKFDERTGYAGFWNRRLSCWGIAWHAVRGDAIRTC